MFDIRDLVNTIEEIVARHNLGTGGAYRRWNWQDEQGGRDLGLNPYGCADAANILYTIGHFPGNPEKRGRWIETLQGLQDRESGFFHEPTHHEIHTTAHCIAALELFDARPPHALRSLAPLRNVAKMTDFLENLDWKENPWSASHQGAGIYVALVLDDEVSFAWQEAYFSWLWEAWDPASGFLRKGCVAPVPHGDSVSIFPHLAGTFHYLFNHEYARRPLRYPKAMVDSCLEIWNRQLYPLGRRVGFAEIDWIYCLTRSLRQTGHRFADCQEALTDFAERYVPYLQGLDKENDEGLNDLHSLFGSVCALAELQRALPGTILTERPLKLVLDRRPFI
ncbi:MAG: hypothetical protein U9R48_07310 [Chloroflexota bacterium]|nr:hypothetical protein [Chloroflexota bacterium]